MDKVKVNIENRQKQIKIPTGMRMLLRRCCTAVLKMEGFSGSAEVNVMFVDDKQIAELYTNFRKIPEPTDVLSFPMGENGDYPVNPESGAYILGDVVISVERAMRQAEDYNHSFQREMGYLTTHSMLHLLGYDHVNGGLEAATMREKEEAVMVEVGHPQDMA